MALNNMGLGMTITAEDAATATFAKVDKGLDQMRAQADKASERMREVGAALQGIGTKMMAVGAAGLAGLGLATNSAAKFEHSITEVGTLIDHSKFSVADMTKLTKDMAQTYGGDLSTQVKALYQGISAGADNAAKAQGLLSAANELSIAGGADQATSILGLTKILNNYSMEFSRASEVSDAFVTAIRGGATTMPELGDAVGQVAASAKNAGVSFKELIGVLGTAATLGKDTASSAAGLKAVFAGIAHPTAEAAAEATKLGIAFSSKGLREAGGLQGFLKKITSSSKFTADSMNQLFGSQEAVGLMSALAADKMSAFNKMMVDMGDSSGAAKKAFDEMSGTLSQQMSVLKANFQVLAVNIGNVLMPYVKQLVAWIKQGVTWFNNLSEPVRKTISMFLAVASITLVVVGGLLLMTGTVMKLIAMTEGAIAVIGGVIEVLAVMGVALVAIAALGYVFYVAYRKNLGGIADFFDELYTKAKLVWDGLTQLFSDGGFSGAVLKDMDKAENGGVKAFVIQVFLWVNRLKNFFVTAWDAFSKGIEALGPVFEEFKTALRGLWALFAPAQDKPEEAKSAFQSFGEVGAKVGNALAITLGYVVKGITAVINVATGFWEVFGPALMGTWTALKLVWSAVLDVASAIGGAFNTGGQGASNTFKSLGEMVGWVAAKLQGLVQTALFVSSVLIRVIGNMVAGVVGYFVGLWNSVKGIFNFLKGLLAGDGALMWYGFKQMVFGVIQSIVSVLFSMITSITGVFDGIAKKLGKDLGLSKGINDFKNDTLKSLETGLGLDKPAPGVTPADSAAGPPATAGAPGALPLGGVPAPGTGVFTGGTTGAGAAPGVAAAGGAPSGSMGTDLKNALQGASFGPQELKADVKLILDQSVLASAMQKIKLDDGARSFGPTPTTT